MCTNLDVLQNSKVTFKYWFLMNRVNCKTTYTEQDNRIWSK